MFLKRKEITNNKLYPIVMLERFFPHHIRHSVYETIGNAVVLLGLFIFSFYFFNETMSSVLGVYMSSVLVWMPKIIGVALILFSVWAVVFFWELFFRSYYFKRTNNSKNLLTFDVLTIIDKSKNGDITKAFLFSMIGREIMLRCGIGARDIEVFLKNRTTKTLDLKLPPVDTGVFGVKDFIVLLLEDDNELREFLSGYEIGESDCVGAAKWVLREENKRKYKERWWGKDQLRRVKSIGEDWSYGQTYALNKYSSDIFVSRDAFAGEIRYGKEILHLEAILGKSQEANAIIVGEAGVGKIDVVYDLMRKILKGSAPEVLLHKRIVVLNTDILISFTGDKITFEREMQNLFDEASRAGNIILVFEDFPAFITSAETLGSDVISLIDPYLSSASIQVIAVSRIGDFHQLIENSAVVMRRFEKVAIEEPEEGRMSAILENVAVALEGRYKILFTYPSIIEIINSARNYFPSAVMPEKAIDLLNEVAPLMRKKKKRIVKKEDVLNLVEVKTNIPVGEIKEDERDKLMRLEEILHKRIVGQNEAISLISSAIRRARAGVRDLKKPIGSFLFIGPTGVGKTETAKALAQVFFGDERAVARLDMSEYQTGDALTRLIGSFETSKTGALTKILKEKPYGVLLLDEFEKTNPDIHDLFLQILDEGFFSDMKGRRINARNIIFIATSNAGSDVIWKAAKEGKDISEMKDELVGEIIKAGRFKPELLNRFDGIVLFHPLEIEHLKKIARIMLTGLQKRLKGKGIGLVVNDVLVEYVAREGYDPVFGARPMSRVIQEKVEQKIADGLIGGKIQKGSSVEFNPADLE